MSDKLREAIERGHKWRVIQLLEEGVDVDTAGYSHIKSNTWNPIYTASVSGRLEILLLLLNRGADINREGGEHGTALSGAAYYGRLDIVLHLLDRGADINVSGGRFGTPLCAAAAGGRNEIVLLLLGRGIDIDGTAECYYTALSAAAYQGQIDTMLLLLDWGADVNASGEDCPPAIATAALGGFGDAILLLLERGADINAMGGSYGTALGAISAYWYSMLKLNIVSLLLEKGANVNAFGGIYGTPLATLAYRYNGSLEVVSMLLNHGANLNAVGGKYGSVLASAAASKSHPSITGLLDLLLEKGAEINLQGPNSLGTALIVAAGESNLNTLSFLLDRGADINACTVGGGYGTALAAAAFCRNYNMTRLLLDRGADINIVGGLCGTALAAACSHHEDPDIRIVSLLLERGAEIDLVGNREYGNALTIATNNENIPLVTLLVDRGADININTAGGSYGTGLGIAVGKGNMEMVQIMIAGRGAVISSLATGQYGSSLGIAAHRGDQDMVQFLIEHDADALHVGGSYKTKSGMYPNALDAAEAEDSKASPGLRALLADIVRDQTLTMRQRITTYDELSARPPFPMPFTELHPTLYTPSQEHASIVAAKILSSTVFCVGEFLTPEQADVQCQHLDEESLIRLLSALMAGLQASTAQRLHGWLQNDVRYFIARNIDFGLAYAAVRAAWKHFHDASDDNVISVQRGEWHWHAKLLADTRAGAIYIHEDSKQELIRSPYSILPRRIWDLRSNRVIQFAALQSTHDNSNSPFPEFWAISHSWANKMHSVNTSINQYQWLVPFPKEINLDMLRFEMRVLRAEYVWLDVLCLRQQSEHNTGLDFLKREEWRLDVPTIGNIYRAAKRIVRYFNGLGLKFSKDGWDDPRHWLNRAWTLQEIQTEHNTINGGVPRDKSQVLMNIRGKVLGKDVTLRRALRPVLRLAAEVDSPHGCSVYELVREMARRHATQPVDKLSGLFYLLRTTELPCYNEKMTSEDFWTECFHLLPAERKLEILFDYPYRGSDKQWFPTWAQMIDWPEREPECEHASTRAESSDLCATQTLADGSFYVPNVWCVSPVLLYSTPNSNEYDSRVRDRFLGFYSPYLCQEQIKTRKADNFSIQFTLCIWRPGNLYTWLVCEQVEKRVEKRVEKQNDNGSSSGETYVLKKVSVLRTDSLSDLSTSRKHDTPMLRKFNCLFV